MFRLTDQALRSTSVRICSEANPVIGVKAGESSTSSVCSVTPVGPYFKGGAKADHDPCLQTSTAQHLMAPVTSRPA